MAATYSSAQIEKKLAGYEGWELSDDGQIHKTFTLDNFVKTMLFANAVGHFAEAANHHPDMLIHSYKNIRISMMSHDADGITDKDFNLVSQIESLVAE